MQNVNHMWSDVLRLAGCGERAVLSSQTAIQWHLLLCLFVEHKSELKVFLKSIERKKKKSWTHWGLYCGKEYLHEAESGK